MTEKQYFQLVQDYKEYMLLVQAQNSTIIHEYGEFGQLIQSGLCGFFYFLRDKYVK